ncbi:hypothetical protein GCM10009818_36550 [Nakamurella flavida]
MTLLLAVTLALVGPVMGGRGVRGDAAAAPLPGPPAVGDCLLREPTETPTGPAALVTPEAEASPAQATNNATLPAVGVTSFGSPSTGGCAGGQLGEVVAVITDRAAVTGALTRSSGADRDARCRAAAVDYVGLRTVDGVARCRTPRPSRSRCSGPRPCPSPPGGSGRTVCGGRTGSSGWPAS